jgi:hypothetical protein
LHAAGFDWFNAVLVSVRHFSRDRAGNDPQNLDCSNIKQRQILERCRLLMSPLSSHRGRPVSIPKAGWPTSMLSTNCARTLIHGTLRMARPLNVSLFGSIVDGVLDAGKARPHYSEVKILPRWKGWTVLSPTPNLKSLTKFRSVAQQSQDTNSSAGVPTPAASVTNWRGYARRWQGTTNALFRIFNFGYSTEQVKQLYYDIEIGSWLKITLILAHPNTAAR